MNQKLKKHAKISKFDICVYVVGHCNALPRQSLGKPVFSIMDGFSENRLPLNAGNVSSYQQQIKWDGSSPE